MSEKDKWTDEQWEEWSEEQWDELIAIKEEEKSIADIYAEMQEEVDKYLFGDDDEEIEV